jgi:hypothetical protein
MPGGLRAGALAVALLAGLQAGQAVQFLYVSLTGQDSLTATAESMAWSMGEDGLTLSGSGLSSLAWTSWDENGRWEIFAIGKFNISARQRVNLTKFFNETNENESSEEMM